MRGREFIALFWRCSSHLAPEFDSLLLISALPAFLAELGKLRFAEGENLAIEPRWIGEEGHRAVAGPLALASGVIE
jgi:hypothetical protein